MYLTLTKILTNQKFHRALNPIDSSVICTETAFRIQTTEIGLVLHMGGC